MEGFKMPKKAYGKATGPQGTGGQRPGGKIPYVNNPQGTSATSHGSKPSALAPQGERKGQVGK